jgi:hypothetical protein
MLNIDLRELEIQTDAKTLPNNKKVDREMLKKDLDILKDVKINRTYIANVHPMIASFNKIKQEIGNLAGAPGIFICRRDDGNNLVMYGFGYDFRPDQLVNYEIIVL